MSHKIKDIINDDMCLGCGMCQTLDTSGATKMGLNKNGFYHPKEETLSSSIEFINIVSDVCPGTNAYAPEKSDSFNPLWGNVISCYKGAYFDSEAVNNASSGGVVSGLAIELRKSDKIDAVLHVGSSAEHYKSNKLKVSKTREDVIEKASSRYAPAIIFADLISLLERSKDRFCFIGKPCDISTLSLFLKKKPQYKDRFILTVAIFCAGIPSYVGTEKVIDEFDGVAKPISKLRYRGNGWPGFFSFQDSNKQDYQMSYNDSWGKVLNRYLQSRCKVCPDGVGFAADISVGDAWDTQDGYPDFSEKDGLSLVLVRTERANTLLKEIKGAFSLERQEVDVIKSMQPFQYKRRIFSFGRWLAFSLLSKSKLKFDNLLLFNRMFELGVKKAVIDFKGAISRALKIKR